jgi:hypothetical protein
VIGRKAYRTPGRAIVPGWACVVMFFLIGVVTAVGSPGNPGKGGTPGVVLGVIAVVMDLVRWQWGPVPAGSWSTRPAWA